MKIYGDSCPCKGCNDRNAQCHSKCEKYRLWKNSGVTVNSGMWVSDAKKRAFYKSIHKNSR